MVVLVSGTPRLDCVHTQNGTREMQAHASHTICSAVCLCVFIFTLNGAHEPAEQQLLDF